MAISVSSAIHAANEVCKERYDKAVHSCGKELKNFCLDVKDCKTIRTKCPQSVNDMASCEELKLCAKNNTPKTYSSTCVYEWSDPNSNEGSCKNINGSLEKVTVICPGRSVTMAKFNDLDFNCKGQTNNYDSARSECEKAVSYYYRSCAGDIDRPSIKITDCDAAKEPLNIQADTVTAERKSLVDMGRSYSKNHSDQYSFQTRLEQSASAVLGQ